MGRKKMKENEKMVSVGIKVTQKQFKFLQLLKQTKYLSYCDTVRLALDDYIAGLK